MSKTYKTVAGDMWDSVAKAQLGGERYMSLLIEANPQYMEYVVFPAGLTLTLPEITTPIVENLPPWKR